MSVLSTAIDPRSPAYLQNRSVMLERLGQLTTAVTADATGPAGPPGTPGAGPAPDVDADAPAADTPAGGHPGDGPASDRHRDGLPARERIELLIDRDTPLLELSPTIEVGTGNPTDAGVVTAIGVVEGRLCVITADSAVARNGVPSPYTIWKIRRAVEIAQTNGLALISLLDRTGQSRVSGFVPLPPVAPARKDAAGAGDLRIPTLAVLLGETTPNPVAQAPQTPAALGQGVFMSSSLVPGAFDHTIVVRERTAGRWTTPPTVLRAARCRQPGPESLVAADETDAIRLARVLLARLTGDTAWPPGPDSQGRWTGRPGAPRPVTAPRYTPNDLLAVAPADSSAACDPREVLARILDGSWFDEFDPGHGSSVCAGWGAIHGRRVAVLADCRGPLGPPEVAKLSQFMQVTASYPTPMLFLRGCGGRSSARADDAPGDRAAGPFDRAFWPQGPIEALGAARLPRISLHVGAAPTDGDEPHFRFRWPGTLTDDPDDGVIDPRDTRTVLGLCLAVLAHGIRPIQQGGWQ